MLCVCFTVPSDSPQTFESVAEHFSVNFTWTPPTTPNGIITGYNLIVSKLSTTTTNNYNTTSYTYDVMTQSVSLDGFLPFQKYNATIKASTVVGYGPMATTEGRTEQGKPKMSLSVQPVQHVRYTIECIIKMYIQQSYILSIIRIVIRSHINTSFQIYPQLQLF